MAIVVACCGQKGGCGKSLLTRSLAAELARKRKTVIVADLDVGQRTVAEWAKARAANKIKPEIRVEVVDPDEEPDFRIPELRAEADYVLTDAPGWSDELTLQLGAAADVIILPTEPSVDDMRPTIRLFHELEEAGIDRERIVVVLNRVQSAAEKVFAEGYFDESGIETLDTALPNQPIYRKASNVGQAATEVSSESPRVNARALIAALLKVIDGTQKQGTAKRAEEPLRFKEGQTW